MTLRVFRRVWAREFVRRSGDEYIRESGHLFCVVRWQFNRDVWLWDNKLGSSRWGRSVVADMASS